MARARAPTSKRWPRTPRISNPTHQGDHDRLQPGREKRPPATATWPARPASSRVHGTSSAPVINSITPAGAVTKMVSREKPTLKTTYKGNATINQTVTRTGTRTLLGTNTDTLVRNTLAAAASPSSTGAPSAANFDCGTARWAACRERGRRLLLLRCLRHFDGVHLHDRAVTGLEGHQASSNPGRTDGRRGMPEAVFAMMEGMHVVLTLVGIVTVVIAVAGLASRFDLPSPLVLILVGVAAPTGPSSPTCSSSPEVVLFGLLPPLLYAAALQTSLVDFNANRRAILLLSVGLVAFTTIGVAVLVNALLPDLGWPAAFAIGAVVAPPDAVAATTIGRRIGLPRRIVTILEGESLLNDATALVALRTAIVATVAWQVLARDFLVAAGGGIAVGLGVLLRGRVRAQARDRPADRQRPELPDPVRGVRRRRGDPCLRGDQRRGRRAAARSQVAGPADGAVPDRRAHDLAQHRVPARELGVPADRPAGAHHHRRRRR